MNMSGNTINLIGKFSLDFSACHQAIACHYFDFSSKGYGGTIETGGLHSASG